MEDKKLSLLAHFENLFMYLTHHTSNYDFAMATAANLANSKPEHSATMVLLTEIGFKFNMIGLLYNFDKLFESFMGSLDEKERESVGKVRFLLDELRKNQPKINGIHDTYKARLQSLADPKGKKGARGVDFDSIAINDLLIIAQSLSLFDGALDQIFPDECDHLPAHQLDIVREVEGSDPKLVRKAVKAKMRKLEALGIEIPPDERPMDE